MSQPTYNQLKRKLADAKFAHSVERLQFDQLRKLADGLSEAMGTNSPGLFAGESMIHFTVRRRSFHAALTAYKQFKSTHQLPTPRP